MNKVNSEVYVDISIIIKMMPEEMRNKINKNFINFIEDNQSTSYSSNINPKIPLKNQELRQETKEMLGIIYRDYLCSKEEREKLIKNEKIELERIENEKRERYNPDNIFRKENNLKVKENTNTNDIHIVKYKESLFNRILNRIKCIFHIK